MKYNPITPINFFFQTYDILQKLLYQSTYFGKCKLTDRRLKMSGNFRKEDLRIMKTHKALTASMYTLLERRKFARITVNDLCEEALISRATFYIHFCDKYNLLSYCLDEIKDSLLKEMHHFTYERMEQVVNQFIRDNVKVITNVAEDEDSEVLDLLRDFIFATINTFFNKEVHIQPSPNAVLATFCSGGMVSLLLWQIKNKFPQETPLIDTYLFEMLKYLIEWDQKNDLNKNRLS